MKIRIDIDKSVDETEIVIKCREQDSAVRKLHQTLMETAKKSNLVFSDGNKEYYISVDSILFFETSGKGVNAHTADRIYKINKKLYELEEILPSRFVRVSKSTILNVAFIYSVERNITSSSLVQFNNSHKKTYVSRSYYKEFKKRLEESR